MEQSKNTPSLRQPEQKPADDEAPKTGDEAPKTERESYHDKMRRKVSTRKSVRRTKK